MDLKIEKLGLFGLATLVVSSMVGGGIFSLPQNMAANASVGAILISWIITGFGMFFLANTFIILARVKPHINSGIYKYAEECFGSYLGFTIGWGYWLCNNFSNIGLAVMSMNALNYFFPGVFTGGNTVPAIACISILIWCYNFLILRGVRQTAFLNTIATVIKITSLGLFILIMVLLFSHAKFRFDFWGNMIINGNTLGSLSDQVKSTMLVTLWTFIGIETAIVLSARAKNKKTVGNATLLGFFVCLVIYILLSVLPFGFLTQRELAAIPDPSTAGIMEKIIGKPGAWLMNIGVLVAVLSCWLSWTLILIETPYAMAENKNFPKIFLKKNKNDIPIVSVYTTSIVMQMGVCLLFFSDNAWKTMLSITGVMVLPAYFTSTIYLFKITRNREYSDRLPIKKSLATFISISACIFTIWLMYSAGINYLMMAFIFFSCGIPMYIWSKRQNSPNGKMFAPVEKIIVAALLILSAIAVYLFINGIMKI